MSGTYCTLSRPLINALRDRSAPPSFSFEIVSRFMVSFAYTCDDRCYALPDGINRILARHASSSSYDIEAMTRFLLLRSKNDINIHEQRKPPKSSNEESTSTATTLKLKPQFFGTGGYVAVLDQEEQLQRDNTASMDNTSSSVDRHTFQNAAVVIRHYGGTHGSLSSLRLMSGHSAGINAQSHTNSMIANQQELLPLVPTEIMMITSSSASRVRLTPAEICYSVLLEYVLPLERGTRFVDGAGAIGDSDYKCDADVAIELASLTIQALIRESRPGKNFRLGGEGDAISTTPGSNSFKHSNRDTLRNAKLADEVLRRLVTAQLVSSSDTGTNRNDWIWSKRETAMTRAYNMALNSWSVAAAQAPPAASREAALRAERLLLEMAKSDDSEGDNDNADDEDAAHFDGWLGIRLDSPTADAQYLMELVSPRAISFNTVMTAWAKSVHGSEGTDKRSRSRRGRGKPTSRSDGTYAAKRAEAILKLMIDISSEAKDYHLAPTAASFGIVMQAWAKSGHPEATSKVLKLLDDLQHRNIRPTVPSYVAVMTSFSRSDAVDAVHEADQFFSTIPGDIINAELCNALIGVHARVKGKLSNRYVSCRRIDEIIEQMSSGDGRFIEQVIPDRITYGTAIMAWSMLANDGAADSTEPLSTTRECAERARSHFNHLLHMCGHMQIPHGISVHNLNDCLRAYLAARMPAEAESVFSLSIQNRPFTPRPDTTSYSLIVQAHASCATHEAFAADMALYWLRQFEENVPEKSRRYDFSDTQLWNAVIDAFCTRNKVSKAEELLQEMIRRYERELEYSISESRSEVRAPRPNTHSFASCLSAYLRLAEEEPSSAGEYAKRAENLIDKMEEMHSKSRQQAQSLSRLARVKPNSAVYNTLLSIYSKAEDVQAYLEKSEDVFERMKRKCSEGNESCAPDKYTLTCLLNMYTKSNVLEGKDADAKAIYLLREIRSANPSARLDVAVYNAILKNIASANRERAEEFFSTIPERSTASYSILISACGRLGTEEGANRGLELFDELDDSSNTTIDAAVIAHVLLCQLKLKDSPIRAKSFLEKIESRYPNTVQARHYNIALQACAEADTSCAEALPIAMDIFNKIETSDTVTATDATYSNLLKVLARHIPADDKRRTALLSGIFKKAAKRGCVSFFVYDAFRKATNPSVYKRILKHGRGGKVSYSNIPQEWKRSC